MLNVRRPPYSPKHGVTRAQFQALMNQADAHTGALLQTTQQKRQERAEAEAAALRARQEAERERIEAARRLQLREAATEKRRREFEADRLRELEARRAAAREAAAEREAELALPAHKRRRLHARDSESPPPRKRATGLLRAQQSRMRSSSPATDVAHLRVVDGSQQAAPAPSRLAGKAGLKASFDVHAIQPLNLVKRDLRTVDEVSRDLAAARAPPIPARSALRPASPSATSSARSAVVVVSRPGMAPVPAKRKASPPPPPPPLPIAGTQRRDKARIEGAPRMADKGKQRASSSPGKSPRKSPPPAPLPRKAEPAGYDRDEIWAMFGRRRADYAHVDDSDSSDMEDASFAALDREERRAGALARREDEVEQQRIEARRRAKAARLAGKARA